MKKSTLFLAVCILQFAICNLQSVICFSQYTKLLDFAGAADGRYPHGSLFSDGTFLYGTASNGGANDSGAVFKIKPDGTGYSKLLDLSGAANGKYPYSALISDGTFLYGTTTDGGINDDGVVFKIKPDGTGYSKLLDFAGAANGKTPYGSLISDGAFLYGMTYTGGTNNMGVIFKIKPDGTGYAKLLDFAGAANGKSPYSNLISDGTFLYGMTYSGGANNLGVIFKIKPDGTGYAKLLDFTGIANGSNPTGPLFYDGTFLYGMTNFGGTNDKGVIFKIKPDGTGYANLMSFAGAANGRFAFGGLISDGTFLYGMTTYGGTNDDGVIFKIKPDGTGYAKLLDFTGIANGKTPYGSLIYDGSSLYGMTFYGGTYSYGVIFKYQICTPPAVTANATSTTVCAGTSVTLTGGGATSYIWTGGVTDGVGFVPSSTNTYTVTGTDANGCTNTAATSITVNYPPATPTITVNMSTLASGSATGNQWYLNGNLISGATNQNYNAVQNGLYTVCVTDANGCSSCSAPYNYTGTGITENNNANDISVYPNPGNGIFTVTAAGYKYEIEIYNIMGEKIFQSVIQQLNNSLIDFSSQPDGIYFLNIITGQGTANKKLIINK
ncbi:MAG: T9SS type A sorting domain-containing protein [Bacteroidetes bacterium]|nr:MAG: T9SS type A sorting domain-containing protein [Bacteroidota bacterium]